MVEHIPKKRRKLQEVINDLGKNVACMTRKKKINADYWKLTIADNK